VLKFCGFLVNRIKSEVMATRICR